MPSLEWSGQPEAFLTGTAREVLERSVLPDYLHSQRWFGGKARTIASVRLDDWGAWPSAGPARAFLALFRVTFTDGTAHLYFLPLAVTTGPAAAALLEAQRSWVLVHLTGMKGEAVLHDALADNAVCTALLQAIGTGAELTTQGGRVRAVSTTAFADLRGDPKATPPVDRAPATSSNTLIFYDRRLLLKLFRRLEPGINPDFEIGRFLTEDRPFPRIPRVAGALEYHRPGAPPVTLALLQALIPNQGDGWTHALEELGHYFERVGRRTDTVAPDPRSLPELSEAEPSPAAVQAIGPYLHAAAATLGRRTAEMHLALAADTRNPAFAPERLTAADLHALDADVAAQGETALAALRQNVGRLPEVVVPAARRLLDEGPKVIKGLREDSPPVNAAKMRCHGDYHLGQVLWVDHDFFLLDFEGEPTRTVEERRAKQSPLKDVAGMLRSFHYAAYAGLFAHTHDRPDDFGRLEPWADLWFRWTSAVFLRAYRTTAAGAVFLPAEPRQFSVLLDAFMLGKAFYELAYELNNRPDWVRIPLRGILALL